MMLDKTPEAVWNSFLEKLNQEHEFDRDLKKYLEALRYVSEITTKTLECAGARERIREKLKNITVFIGKYKDTHYEIGLIKGFKTNDPDGMAERDYYYYIADQKIKASVYCARYLNFIERAFREQRDTVYIKYMLFQNMLREIRYMGAAYQYLWHWEQQTKTVYRGTFDEKEEIRDLFPETKELFFRKIFSECVDHINQPLPGFYSYSENLFLDIYKYLRLNKGRKESGWREIIKRQGVCVKARSSFWESEEKAKFAVIKDLYINGIFLDGNFHPFYEYIQEMPYEDTQNLILTVEIFPGTLEGERNAKDTLEHMRDRYFPQYMKTLGIYKEFSRTTVADDKEVIICDKFCRREKEEKREVDLNECGTQRPFGDYPAGTCFQMRLSKEDVIYLLLKIGETYRRDENKSIADGVSEEILSSFKEIPGGEETNTYRFGLFPRPEESAYEIEIEIEEEPAGNGQSRAEQWKERIFEEAGPVLRERYTRILNQTHPMSDFILSTLEGKKQEEKEADYLLVKEDYKRYKEVRMNEDPEITSIKKYVFQKEA